MMYTMPKNLLSICVNFALATQLAGAWIEIATSLTRCAPNSASLPSRERGLKSAAAVYDKHLFGSLPSRERGLKYSSFI